MIDHGGSVFSMLYENSDVATCLAACTCVMYGCVLSSNTGGIAQLVKIGPTGTQDDKLSKKYVGDVNIFCARSLVAI